MNVLFSVCDINKIKNVNSRKNFEYVLQSYYSKNYKASILLLYNLLVNDLYEKLKLIEEAKGKEETLENKIKKEFNIDSFIKISNNQIKVTIVSSKHSYELANNIIRILDT